MAFDAAFERIFRASKTPIAFANASTLKFVDANEAFCAMVGYANDELLAMTPIDMTAAEDAEKEVQLFQEVVADQRFAYSLEKRFIHKDGQIIWASVSVTVLVDEHGVPELGVAICEDITERKRAVEQRLRIEQEMLHAQKLESLGLLAGGIAHDFNNVLIGVIGNAELAKQLSKQPELEPLLDDLLLSAKVAADLSNQMLAYSGGGIVEREPVALAEVIETSLRLLDSRRRSCVRVESRAVSAFADLVQVRQLVLNLITNACEAISDGGQVVVRISDECPPVAPHEVVLGQTDPTFVYLTVEDDGAGIPPDCLELIFEPFRSTKGRGRGLGLAAVSGIVRAHEGLLALRSELGTGTSFIVGLPRGTSPPVAPQSEPPDIVGPKRVLVVDDDPIVRTVIARLLRAENLDVVEAHCVSDACELLRASSFDVVLTDLSMPDGSGVDVADAASPTPVIGMTGFAEFSDGPNDAIKAFLRKPFSYAELLASLAQAAR